MRKQFVHHSSLVVAKPFHPEQYHLLVQSKSRSAPMLTTLAPTRNHGVDLFSKGTIWQVPWGLPSRWLTQTPPFKGGGPLGTIRRVTWCL